MLMKCGHESNGINADNQPVCIIDVGLTPDAEIPAEKQPDYSGRNAKCYYCKKISPSSSKLAFLRYQPEEETDSFYCGCKGWN